MRALLILVLTGAIAHADPLVVAIKPASLTWRATAPVDVALEVKNPSKHPQSIKVWLCSWGEHWKSNDPELLWAPWACDKNAEKVEVLPPGGSKQWTLSMYAVAKAKLGPHRLRLGFAPSGGTRRWSNEVTITVRK